jgi:hypothetical protein
VVPEPAAELRNVYSTVGLGYAKKRNQALRVLVWVNFAVRCRSGLGNYAENALSFA